MPGDSFTAEWRALTDEERAHFVDIAWEDPELQSFYAACLAYNASDGAGEVKPAKLLPPVKAWTLAETWDIFCAAWTIAQDRDAFVEERFKAKNDVLRALYSQCSGLLKMAEIERAEAQSRPHSIPHHRQAAPAPEPPTPEASTPAEVTPAP